MPHEDSVVITLKIMNCLVNGVLIDRGSVVEIIFYNTLGKLDYLMSFNTLNRILWGIYDPMGTIGLEIIAREKLLMVEFVIVNAASPYNVIIGRGWINPMKGIPLTLH